MKTTRTSLIQFATPTRTQRLKTRLTAIRDKLGLAAFRMLKGRAPNEDEYFGSRTLGELLRKAL